MSLSTTRIQFIKLNILKKITNTNIGYCFENKDFRTFEVKAQGYLASTRPFLSIVPILEIQFSLFFGVLFFHRNNPHFSLRNPISEKSLLPLAVICFLMTTCKQKQLFCLFSTTVFVVVVLLVCLRFVYYLRSEQHGHMIHTLCYWGSFMYTCAGRVINSLFLSIQQHVYFNPHTRMTAIRNRIKPNVSGLDVSTKWMFHNAVSV